MRVGGAGRGALALGVLALALATSATRGSGAARPLFVPVLRGLDAPVHVAAPATQPDRLYVVEQPGVIRVVRGGRLLPKAFLDIRGSVRSGGEQGLLSVAFHPNYAEDPRIYVDFTDLQGNTRVVEYRVRNGRAQASTARQLLFVEQPYANHNGGQLQFGPDGLLYVGMGDGGSAGDPQRRAQDLASRLGKLLRVNVARPGAAWRIAGYGLRNPWRFSFDRTTGDLWIADVGQDRWEEVDHRTRSQLPRMWNYGWNRFEGRSLYGDNPLTKVAPLVFPVAVYYHDLGCSVTGGYVYRGPAASSLRGRYVYGDYCSGRLWSLSASHPGAPRLEAGTIPQLSSFGQDARGNLYATSLAGTLYRLAR